MTNSRRSAGARAFCENLLEPLILQGQVGIHPLEAAILVLQLLKSLHVRGLESAILGLPLLVRGGADPVVPPDLIDGATNVSLLKNGHDLGFGEFGLSHENLLARGQNVLLMTVSKEGELTAVRWLRLFGQKFSVHK